MNRSGGSCHSDWKDRKGSRKHSSFIGQDKICASFHGAQPFSSNRQLVYTKKQWISLVLAHSSASEPIESYVFSFLHYLLVGYLFVALKYRFTLKRYVCIVLLSLKYPFLLSFCVLLIFCQNDGSQLCFIFHTGTCRESSNHKVYSKYIYYTTSKCLTIWHSGPCFTSKTPASTCSST